MDRGWDGAGKNLPFGPVEAAWWPTKLETKAIRSRSRRRARLPTTRERRRLEATERKVNLSGMSPEDVDQRNLDAFEALEGVGADVVALDDLEAVLRDDAPPLVVGVIGDERDGVAVERLERVLR
ncbi:hypothetical protein ACFQO4_15435 [Saliphagus sp. GCM10025334]